MNKNYERLELNKILATVAGFAALEEGKEIIACTEPADSLSEAKKLLALTEEAKTLLFEIGTGSVEYFPPLGDVARRAAKGASLTCKELTDAAALMRSSRVLYDAITKCSDGRIAEMRELVAPVTPFERLEREIGDKILGENELADTASEKLYALRREIRLAGERIKARLAEYLTGEERKFLQDGIVTVRGDRYVVPVKAEYKRSIRGFVHDRSATGATVFIEPEEIFEMNNELRGLMLDEKEEVARILKELSRAVGAVADGLEINAHVLAHADAAFARAEYAHAVKGVKPQLNDRGIIEIVKGRHPLLDAKKAVPVSLGVGGDCRFLVISGSNTGGKTVTLKMCGLFCLMASCGLFVPAAEGTRLSVFDKVCCDVGDSQSIEENLSTFSSHIVNLRDILNQAGERSLVLVDEPGGGTDPEEGQALATAILSALVNMGCVGIVTTHYSALKEYALKTEGLENGCMEFDAGDYRPLYRLKMGMPGASNALKICERLGLERAVIEDARAHLSDGARAYERTLTAAEDARIRAEEEREEGARIKAEWSARLAALEKEEEKFKREREKFLASSKAEAKRIVGDRCAQAEELLAEIEEIFKKETLSESDLIHARTLKNQIADSAIEREEAPARLIPAERSKLKVGDKVIVGSMDAEGEILALHKDGAEVQCGLLRVRAGADDLFLPRAAANNAGKNEGKKKDSVRVVQRLNERAMPVRECNLIGMNVSEALLELENFLDGATVSGLEEVRIVHGMGTGKLRGAVKEYLKKHPRVKEFRLGVYGEGESGVTIAKLK